MREVTDAWDSTQRRPIGRHLVMTAGCLAAIVLAFVFAWAMSASYPEQPGDLAGFLLPLCLAVTAWSILAGARIVMDARGYVDLVGPIVTRRVAVAAISDIDHTDGLALRLVDGRRLGSVAYGRSLLGQLLGYPRSMRAADRLRAAIGALPSDVVAGSAALPAVEWRPRVGAFAAAIAIDAVLVVGALVLNVHGS